MCFYELFSRDPIIFYLGTADFEQSELGNTWLEVVKETVCKCPPHELLHGYKSGYDRAIKLCRPILRFT